MIGENRQAAIRLGFKRYYSTCKHHEGQIVRWVTNGSCIHCVEQQLVKYRAKNKKTLVKKRNDWSKANPEKTMINRIRARAKNAGLDFAITIDDIHIPLICPVLEIPLIVGSVQTDNSPSLDRIDNRLGYIKGNVVVVSHLANRIKNNSTPEQLRKVFEFYDKR